MKKINSMDYLLVFGSIILFLSGIALMFNELFNTYLIKTVGIAFLGIILYVISFIFKYILKVDKSFKVANSLGSLAILIAYIMAGCNELMGSWFSINGEGVQLFLASIAFLITILSILTAVLLKSYYYINITFISILVSVFHLLTFFKLDSQISLIILGVIVLVCNLFKFNKFIYNFSSIAVFVYALLTIVFGFSHSFLMGSILVFLNSICLLSILGKYKNIGMEICVVASFIILLGFYLNYNVNLGLLAVITTLIVCVFELVANTFKLVKNEAVNVIYKLVCFFIIIWLAYNNSVLLVSKVVVYSFLTVTAVVNAYIIKHNESEKHLLPIKLAIIIIGIYNLISQYVLLSGVYLYAFIICLFMVIYKILDDKNRTEKMVYLIINILALISMVGVLEDGILEFIIANLIIFINYLVFRPIDNKVLHRVFYTFIVLMLLFTTRFDSGIIPVFLQIAMFGYLAYVNRKDKYSYIVTVLALYFSFTNLIDLVIVNGVLSDIVSSIFYLTLIGISSEILFDNKTHKSIFTSIVIVLELLPLLQDNHTFIVSIYSLIVSLIIILISLKDDNYKTLYYVGLVMGGISLLSLLSFLGGLPVAIYLFIIAIVLILIVSVMIYKYQHREIVPEKKVIHDVINYCGNCGKKVNHDENFCGNCGAKIK